MEDQNYRKYTDIGHLLDHRGGSLDGSSAPSNIDSSTEKGMPSSSKSFKPLFIAALLIIGVISGVTLVSSPQTVQRFAQEQEPILACINSTATCSMKPEDAQLLADKGLFWEFVIEKDGNQIDRSVRTGNSDNISFSSVQTLNNPPYTCRLEIFVDDNTEAPLEGQSCQPNTIAEGLKCENCSCSAVGQLEVDEVTQSGNSDQRTAYMTRWVPNNPPPAQCENPGDACDKIYVYTDDHNGQESQVIPPSAYSCKNIPHPAFIPHQDNKGNPRTFTFKVADKNGTISNELKCQNQVRFTCDDVGGCGLVEINDSCNPSVCDFTIEGTGKDGSPVGGTEFSDKACIDPSKEIVMSPIGPISDFMVDFDDDADDSNGFEIWLASKPRHTYYDNGMYKIRLRCLDQNEQEVFCEKMLSIGCTETTPPPGPSLSPSPSPSPSPTPTPLFCPLQEPIDLNFSYICEGDCGPTAVPTTTTSL